MFCTIISNDDDKKNMIAMDLPGRFPTTSASGNKYIFVMVDYDSDYIKFTPMTSRTKEEMVCCFKLCYNKFKEAGFTARLLKLDNEIFTDVFHVKCIFSKSKTAV